MGFTIEEAKRHLTIFDLWELLQLDGNPGRSCHSPFRADAKPSFSVYADGTRWHDFGTNQGGDAIDFLAMARNLNNEAACRQYLSLAANGRVYPSVSGRRNPISRLSKPAQLRPQLASDAHAGNSKELEQLRALRRLPTMSGIRAASAAGLLRFATLHEHQAWIVTDASERCVVARRLDGIDWEHNKSKAYMLAGSHGSHLIGGHEAEGAMFVLFVEGTPDLLAAFEIITSAGAFARDFRVVCMASASGALSPEDCAFLKAAQLVCIMKHRDEAGERAARAWNKTLYEHGVRNVICDLNGGAKDLNDFVREPHFSAHTFVAALRTATYEQWNQQS